MAFLPLPPGTRLYTTDSFRLQALRQGATLTLGTDGQIERHFEGGDPWIFHSHRAHREGLPDYPGRGQLEPPGGYPLAKVDGQVGWDPDWALLLALTSGDAPNLTEWKARLAVADPLVRHPSPLGPGDGYPLPLAIARAPISGELKLKLLRGLPRDALKVVWQGEDVSNTLAMRVRAADPETLSTLAWALATTGQTLTKVDALLSVGLDLPEKLRKHGSSWPKELAACFPGSRTGQASVTAMGQMILTRSAQALAQLDPQQVVERADKRERGVARSRAVCVVVAEGMVQHGLLLPHGLAVFDQVRQAAAVEVDQASALSNTLHLVTRPAMAYLEERFNRAHHLAFFRSLVLAQQPTAAADPARRRYRT